MEDKIEKMQNQLDGLQQSVQNQPSELENAQDANEIDDTDAVEAI